MENFVKLLDENELLKIMSCLEQFVLITSLPKNQFYVISIWYADIANRFFQSNTQPGSYVIIIKYENNYTKPNIVNHAKNIYNRNLIPIEIIQCTGAYFYAIPKVCIETKQLRMTLLLPAEHSIPKIESFFNLIN